MIPISTIYMPEETGYKPYTYLMKWYADAASSSSLAVNMTRGHIVAALASFLKKSFLYSFYQLFTAPVI
jgi:hypothetical protein